MELEIYSVREGSMGKLKNIKSINIGRGIGMQKNYFLSPTQRQIVRYYRNKRIYENSPLVPHSVCELCCANTPVKYIQEIF